MLFTKMDAVVKFILGLIFRKNFYKFKIVRYEKDFIVLSFIAQCFVHAESLERNVSHGKAH